MPYWKYKNQQNNCPSVAIYVFRDTIRFRATFVNDLDKDIKNLYFYSTDVFLNMLSVRVAGTAEFSPVSLFGDSTLIVESVAAGTEMEFEFEFANKRLELPGYMSVPINITWGNYKGAPTNHFFVSFFLTGATTPLWSLCPRPDLFWLQGPKLSNLWECGAAEDLTGMGFTSNLIPLFTTEQDIKLFEEVG